ncbi:MAG: type II toxin-antitoxin system HicB family antitoxin [Methanoculleus sp.]|nr:type II toxin-antitoxin system HicB family antitoxin [Methanoculleus sp.]
MAVVPELAGCSAFGETEEEALSEVKVAIGLWLETARGEGREIPEPTGPSFSFPAMPRTVMTDPFSVYVVRVPRLCCRRSLPPIARHRPGIPHRGRTSRKRLFIGRPCYPPHQHRMRFNAPHISTHGRAPRGPPGPPRTPNPYPG